MSQILNPSAGGGGGAGIVTINGDLGSITGAAVTIYADNVSNAAGGTVLFTNAGTVSTLSLSNINNNTYLGAFCGNASVACTENTGLGVAALNSVVNGSQCIAIGNGALSSFTGPVGGAAGNTAIGWTVLGALIDGTDNIVIGAGSGSQYLSSESGNIIIDDPGVTGESNVTRIGNDDVSGGQVAFYAGGITGRIAVGSPTLVSADGRITDAGFGAAGQVLTSNGALASPTWQASGSSSGDNFSTYLSAPTGNVTGDGTLFGPILFDGILSNPGSNYSAATGLYTAPANGMYSFTHTICFLGGDLLTTSFLSLWAGSVYAIRAFQITPVAFAPNTIIFSASIFIPMNAGDTMGVSVISAGTNKNVVIYGAAPAGFAATSTFSGFQVA